ncbi:MAG: NAD(P)-dependent oxidoreductase [Moraxellaceae bacterium]|nr:NAD(P)-dependent oxidoreductase [Moraxellaceae bacterium]MDZ4298683.1 NAD(P)-dependent oxidoreductase [Moraxellaceae bacterium]MDZ4385760.1 NAD(P)-dependent oxidoreductase [Moraxellaceae bacterium]
MTNLAFIGLGTMGYPMAGHLLRAGFAVTVWNRTSLKSSQWQQEYGGEIASSPANAAANADIILTCVGRDEDLREVLLGDHGVIQSIKNKSLVIDHSTVSANISRELAGAFSALDCGFIDAPVSGGQQGAINGQLSIFCGGNADDIAKAQPVLASYAKAQAHLGPVGHGQLAKMVNQICVAGVIQGLAEGMRFAELAGLDVDQVMQLVGQGAGSSWQLLNRHKTMQQDHYEHGFAVDWMRKDLDIVLAESAQLGLNLPITTVINDFYREVQVMGGGRWDTSSLLKRLQNQ